MAAPHRIDVHHHVTPPSLLGEKIRAGAGGGPTYAWTIEKTLADMEAGGVRAAIISLRIRSASGPIRRTRAG